MPTPPLLSLSDDYVSEYNTFMENMLSNINDQISNQSENTTPKSIKRRGVNNPTNRTKNVKPYKTQKSQILIEQPYISSPSDVLIFEKKPIKTKNNMLYSRPDNNGNMKYYNEEGMELTPISTPYLERKKLLGEFDPLDYEYKDEYGNIYTKHKDQTPSLSNDTFDEKGLATTPSDYYRPSDPNSFLQNFYRNVSKEWYDFRHGQGLLNSLVTNFAPMSVYTSGMYALNHLTGDEGVSKTYNSLKNHYKNNDPINAYGDTFLSGIGDAFDLSILPYSALKATKAVGNQRLPGDAAFRQGWYNQTPIEMIVDENGNINPSGTNRVLRTLFAREGRGKSDTHTRFKPVNKMTYNPMKYTPEGSEVVEQGVIPTNYQGYQTENLSTFRHMANAAKTAQELPVAQGSTRLNQVASALFHDIGERYDRANHAKVGADLIDKYIANFDPEIYNSVKNHMGGVLYGTPATQALHAADVISGANKDEIMRINSSLWYRPEGDESLFTNLGKTNISDQEQIRRANLFFEENGMPIIPKDASAEEASAIFDQNMKLYRTITRGVNINKPKLSWITERNSVSEKVNEQRKKDAKRYVQGVVQTVLNGKVPTDDNVAETLVSRTPLVKSPMNARGESAAKANLAQDDIRSVYTSNSDEVAAHYSSGEGTPYPMDMEINIPNRGNGTFADEILNNNFLIQSAFSNKAGVDFSRTGRVGLVSNYEIPYTIRTGRSLVQDALSFLQSPEGASFAKEQQTLLTLLENMKKSPKITKTQLNYIEKSIQQINDPRAAAGTKESYTANDFWSRVYEQLLEKEGVRKQSATIEGKGNPVAFTTEGLKRISLSNTDENLHFVFVGKRNTNIAKPNTIKKNTRATANDNRNVSHKGSRSKYLTTNM